VGTFWVVPVGAVGKREEQLVKAMFVTTQADQEKLLSLPAQGICCKTIEYFKISCEFTFSFATLFTRKFISIPSSTSLQ
jgi:hypothetical protein